MKIAILSLNPGHNYGGILQSYALKTVLERMGHEVQVISKKRTLVPLFSFFLIPRYLFRFLRKLLGRSNTPIFAEYVYEKRREVILQSLHQFCDCYLNLRCIGRFSEIGPYDFDAFVVGSDQVWRPKYFTSQYNANIENAFLSFTQSWNVKRIAYAPSFGVDTWEYTSQQTKRCAKFLSHFDAVSVRENTGKKLCEKYFCYENVIHVCDPTMLLSRGEYESLIPCDSPQFKGDLLVYCLDENDELNTLVSKISREKRLTPFYINVKTVGNESIEERIKPSVESWIQAFRDAEFVITDSFHACVFSLIFHKPFLVFGNTNRGLSRFESLLSTFNQQQRLLTCADDYGKNREYPSLDNVDDVFYRLRAQSFQFLNDSLR